jgi:Uma2 family endonuclease
MNARNFVVEILSKSTAANRGVKKDDYSAHGIQEYWIIDPVRKQIEQYILLHPSDKQYAPVKYYGLDNEIEHRVVKGFVIPVFSIFDEAANLETLQHILKNAG